MTTSATRRSDAGCLCCGETNLHAETTIVSPFLAQRAMRATPMLTRLVFCPRCGLRFFDRGLSKSESRRYYEGYRSEAYCVERHRWEPFYTWRAHRDLAAWLASTERRKALTAALSGKGVSEGRESVLDFGGGNGQLIADYPARDRAVFDLSGQPAVAGVLAVSQEEMASRKWDLLVCAQVLEHVSDPRATVSRLADLLATDGRLYLEVPDELWSNRTWAGRMRDRWLAWLAQKPTLLIAADTLSTACRIKLGFLPPFGFIPMREHLQYFTEDALVAIVRSSGLRVVRSGRNDVGQIYVVATVAAEVPSAPGQHQPTPA